MAKAKSEPVERPIVHPEVKFEPAWGKNAITMEKAISLIGWQKESPDDSAELKKIDFLYTSCTGDRIRCLNNLKNRPLYESNWKGLKQELLQRRWSGPNGNGLTVNGEDILISNYGSVLNGQHSLIALIEAELERQKDSQGQYHWSENWPGPVLMDKGIKYGIDESQQTMGTMDTCKPRSITDVLYQSEFFYKFKSSDRISIAKMCDFAIRLLWDRLGFKVDMWAPRKTHSEALEFLTNHMRLIRSIKHISDENAANAIGKYISPGSAAGLLYLMSASMSDAEKYHQKGVEKNEKLCKFTSTDKAEEFFTVLASPSEDFKPVRSAIERLVDKETGKQGSFSERSAILIKAWEVFSQGKLPETADLKLKYNTDKDTGVETLVDLPLIGGIDLGSSYKPEPEAPTAPDPAELEKEKEAIRAESVTKGNGKSSLSVEDGILNELNVLRSEHPEYLFLYQRDQGYDAYDTDATAIAAILRVKTKQRKNLIGLLITKEQYENTKKAILTIHPKLAIVTESKEVLFVEPEKATTPVATESAKPPVKKFTPKPKPALRGGTGS